MHRACHMVPFLWEHVHSIHHYADHPLSRTTYQDHWFDNFTNAIIGHMFAQILMVSCEYSTRVWEPVGSI